MVLVSGRRHPVIKELQSLQQQRDGEYMIVLYRNGIPRKYLAMLRKLFSCPRCTQSQYYDSTVFHRVIHKFMVQGGDPTGTGKGGESVYGKPFRDEIHTRIKFNHRGQVAMANENEPGTNHSQFFFTLDNAPHLDKKHTIFGKVRVRGSYFGLSE